jgi:hypothetical protein
LATVTTTANSCLPPPHAAAGLTMIIEMTATVCAAGDHGEDGRQKIAGSDKHRRVQKRNGRAGDQEKQEI